MPVKDRKQNLTICIALACILLTTAIAYYPAIHGGFVWDDEGYILKNSLVKQMSLQNVGKTFTSFSLGNYHPLTILTYAREYFFFGLNPLPYHAVNIILHLVNCILVFFLIFRMSRNIPVAFITGLLFGIHPLHVESVAWISELKDVLYTLFYMGGLLSYLAYLREGQRKFYVYTLFLFLLSLLSKSMAMSFPIVLFLMDYYTGRKNIRQVIKEKIPFLILSIIFGLFAIHSQRDAMQLNMAYSLLRGTFIASYGLIFYLVKMIFPVGLVPLYHYPYGHDTTMILPLEYMFAPAAVVILGIIVYWSTKYTKKILWGAAFYVITIFPAIQLVPVGHAKAADRYTYVPLIGIFFIVSIFLIWIWNKILKKNIFLKIASLCLVCLLIISLITLTMKQTHVWKSNITLWEYVVKKNPYSYIGYNNLGGEYHRYDREKALQYYMTAAHMKPDYPDPYINMCNIYMLKGERITAISYCLKGIENHPLDRGVANALVTLGDIFQPIDLAFSFQMYRQTITMNPGHDLGYMKLCNLYYSLGQFDSALSLCSDAVRLNPDNSFNYENLGNVYLKMEQYDKAMTSYVKALSINPNLPASHHNLALIYYFSKQYDLAIKHYKAAVSLGMTVNQEFQKTVEQHIRGNPKKDGSHGSDG